MINKQKKLSLKTKIISLILGVILVVGLDQITKFLYSHKTIDFSWFKIVEHNNHGILFGINLPWGLIIVLSILFLIILLRLFFFSKISNFIYYLGIILSFSGGISNLIDRIRFGFVRDFLSINLWSIFNFADITIVIGVILIIYAILINEHTQKSKI